MWNKTTTSVTFEKHFTINVKDTTTSWELEKRKKEKRKEKKENLYQKSVRWLIRKEKSAIGDSGDPVSLFDFNRPWFANSSDFFSLVKYMLS